MVGGEDERRRGSAWQGWGRRYGWRRHSVPGARSGFVCTGKGEESEASAGLRFGGRGTLQGGGSAEGQLDGVAWQRLGRAAGRKKQGKERRGLGGVCSGRGGAVLKPGRAQ